MRLIEIRCVSKKPYSPSSKIALVEFAPWKPDETRRLGDDLAMELLVHDPRHFEFVQSDHPMPAYDKRPLDTGFITAAPIEETPEAPKAKLVKAGSVKKQKPENKTEEATNG